MIKNIYISLSLSFITYLLSAYSFYALFLGASFTGNTIIIYQALLFLALYIMSGFLCHFLCGKMLYTYLFIFSTFLLQGFFYENLLQLSYYLAHPVSLLPIASCLIGALLGAYIANLFFNKYHLKTTSKSSLVETK